MGTFASPAATGASMQLRAVACPRASRRFSRRIAIDLLAFSEAFAIVVGGCLAPLIYAWGGGFSFDWAKHIQICVITAGIAHGCLRHCGLYETSLLHALPVAPARLAASLGLAFAAVFGLGLPPAPMAIDMWIWYGTWITVSFALLLNIRYGTSILLRRMTVGGAFDDRVAVYGSGTVAGRVHEYLQDTNLGIRFAGLFDDRSDANRISPIGPAVNGSLDDLVRACQNSEIDRVIIALPPAADQRTTQIAARLEPLPVSLHLVTHISSDFIDRHAPHRVSELGAVGLLDAKLKPLADWSRVVKEVEDRVLGCLFLILALPVLGVIALAVKLDSRGPALFRQRRTGMNERIIGVLKFRTMHVLEDEGDLKQAERSDARVTRIGGFLRRWSLDELPQLLNVARGEMSLVGPRPHAVAHDDKFGEMLHRYANRRQVKPGITGLAQISGLRGETETTEKMELRLARDLEYVNNWSLWLDCKILLITVWKGWGGKNAY